MLAYVVVVTGLARIRPKALFKGLKPLIITIFVTAVLNMLYGRNRQEHLA